MIFKNCNRIWCIKKYIIIGLFLNIMGVILLAFAIAVPVLPLCNIKGEGCILVNGEIIQLPIPFENPLFLKLGLFLVILGFIFQLIDVFIIEKKNLYNRTP